jgi:hypothetical protein
VTTQDFRRISCTGALTILAAAKLPLAELRPLPRFPRAAGLFGVLAEISRRCPAFGHGCAFPPRQTGRDQNSGWHFQAPLIGDWIDRRPLSLSRTRQIRPLGFLDSDAFAIWREGCFRFTEIQRYRPLVHCRFLFFLFPKIAFQLSLYAFETGFWPSPRL